jgi:hypothetical protein
VVLSAAIVAAALIAAGVAVADGVNPFAGIASANRAQTSQDILPPAIFAQLRLSPGIRLLADTSRLVGNLPSGRSMYVVSASNNEICIVTVKAGKLETESFGRPLDQTEPVTNATVDPEGPGGVPPLSYGVAQDGITSVSVFADGSEETVPVKNNVWAFEGDNNALASITIHYANGTTRTISH